MVAFECSRAIVNVFTNDAFDLKNTKNFIAICKNMEVDNLSLVLNNAIDERKNAFSNYDIESVIKEKIDYVIPRKFHIRNLDKNIIDGKTLEMCEKVLKENSKDTATFSKFATGLIEDDGKDDTDEEE